MTRKTKKENIMKLSRKLIASSFVVLLLLSLSSKVYASTAAASSEGQKTPAHQTMGSLFLDSAQRYYTLNLGMKGGSWIRGEDDVNLQNLDEMLSFVSDALVMIPQIEKLLIDHPSRHVRDMIRYPSPRISDEVNEMGPYLFSSEGGWIQAVSSSMGSSPIMRKRLDMGFEARELERETGAQIREGAARERFQIGKDNLVKEMAREIEASYERNQNLELENLIRERREIENYLEEVRRNEEVIEKLKKDLCQVSADLVSKRSRMQQENKAFYGTGDRAAIDKFEEDELGDLKSRISRIEGQIRERRAEKFLEAKRAIKQQEALTEFNEQELTQREADVLSEAVAFRRMGVARDVARDYLDLADYRSKTQNVDSKSWVGHEMWYRAYLITQDVWSHTGH